MVEECRGCARSLEIIAEPAGPEIVQRTLSPYVLVFGLGEQSESPSFWKVYNEVLSDLPRLALERAAKEYSETGKFFPKPADLKERAMPHASAMRQAAARAKAVIAVRVEAPKPKEPTPEERAAVRTMLASYLDLVKEKQPPRAKRKPVNGPVDDRGVTAEGRALIERMKLTQNIG